MANYPGLSETENYRIRKLQELANFLSQRIIEVNELFDKYEFSFKSQMAKSAANRIEYFQDHPKF